MTDLFRKCSMRKDMKESIDPLQLHHFSSGATVTENTERERERERERGIGGAGTGLSDGMMLGSVSQLYGSRAPLIFIKSHLNGLSSVSPLPLYLSLTVLYLWKKFPSLLCADLGYFWAEVMMLRCWQCGLITLTEMNCVSSSLRFSRFRGFSRFIEWLKDCLCLSRHKSTWSLISSVSAVFLAFDLYWSKLQHMQPNARWLNLLQHFLPFLCNCLWNLQESSIFFSIFIYAFYTYICVCSSGKN